MSDNETIYVEDIMTTKTEYRRGVETVGYLQQEKISVAYMPRERFMELVRKALRNTQDNYDVDLSDRLLPVAESMPRFPMGEWINPKRGCGCVIGEYLVATEVLERRDMISDNFIAENIIDDLKDGEALVYMGTRIDQLVRQELYLPPTISNGSYDFTPYPNAVVFE